MAKHVLIDASLGWDSYFAVMIAMQSEQIQVDAITVLDPLMDRTAHGMLHLLTHLCSEIPVCRGSLWHNEDPSAGKFPKDPVSGILAVEMIHRCALANPGNLTILTHSPLLNVAQFLRAYPDDRDRIHSIVILENRTADREKYGFDFQPCMEPEAANVIFSSGVPVYFVPASVLSVSPDNQAVVDAVSDVPNNIICRFLRNHSEDGRADTAVLSGLASALMATWPEKAETEKRRVTAVSAGEQWGTFQVGTEDSGSSVQVVTRLDYSLWQTPGFGLADTPELEAFYKEKEKEGNHLGH